MTLHHLSLFTGYAGFDIGLKMGGLDVRTIGYVENDDYCQRLIQARIKDGYLDDAPIWSDIFTFDGSQCRGMVDLVTAGFPCPPFSAAGKHLGEADERNLWPETARVISEVGPGLVLLENVPGLLTHGYAGTVVGDLAEIGYNCVWDVVSACEAGAPHTRERLFILAYSNSLQFPPWLGVFSNRSKALQAGSNRSVSSAWMDSISRNAGSGNGHPYRVDRLRTSGNGLVPEALALFLGGIR